MHCFAKNVFEFLYGVAGEKNVVAKRMRRINKFDLIGLWFCPRREAWSEEDTVAPNILLLAESFKTIDQHYVSARKE